MESLYEQLEIKYAKFLSYRFFKVSLLFKKYNALHEKIQMYQSQLYDRVNIDSGTADSSYFHKFEQKIDLIRHGVGKDDVHFDNNFKYNRAITRN